jgi:hypothetical protein
MKRRKLVEDYKPKSFIPLPTIEENESVQIIKELRDPLLNRRREYYTVHESFLQEVSESLEYTLANFKQEIKETKCLRKAMLIYMTLLQLNVVKPDYSRLFQFIMYYPTIVIWIYIFSKLHTLCNFMQSSHKMQKTSSDETLCTISSDDDLSSNSATDSVEKEDQNAIQHSHVDPGTIVTVSVQHSWKGSQAIHNKQMSNREAEYNSDEQDDIFINNDEDYGHFITFPDEEPRKPITPLSYTDELSITLYQRIREAITHYI